MSKIRKSFFFLVMAGLLGAWAAVPAQAAAHKLPREFQGDGVRLNSDNPDLLPYGVRVVELYIVLNGSR